MKYKQVLTICRKELGSYFNSPIAYIIIAGFLILSGYFFSNSLFQVNQATLRSFFSLMPILFILVLPGVAMRLISEERKSGTMEILLTLPISDWDIVLGKFLAALTFLFAMLATTIIYPITIAKLGDPDWGPIIVGYLALLLMGGAFLAISLWASSLTKNQVVALIISIAICLLLTIMSNIATLVPSFLGDIIGYMSLQEHFANMQRGVVDTRDIIYYLSIIFFALLLTRHTIAKRHD